MSDEPPAEEALIAALGVEPARFRQWAAGGKDEKLTEMVRQHEAARRKVEVTDERGNVQGAREKRDAAPA